MKISSLFSLAGWSLALCMILNGWAPRAVAQNINGTPIRVDVDTMGNPPPVPWATMMFGGCYIAHAATSGGRTMSTDGEFVLLKTNCPLDPSDTNSDSDIYVFSRTIGRTELLSRTWTGAASGMCGSATISGDGRFVAYVCWAPDVLPPNYPTSHGRLYMLDRALNTVVPIDITASGGAPNGPIGGGASPQVSGDGNYVLFTSISPNLFPPNTPPITRGSLRWARTSGSIDVVNVAIDGSFVPSASQACRDSMSFDGERVLFCGLGFEYAALPLLNPSAPHIFIRDMAAGTTTLVSTDQDGVLSSFFQGNHILSEDGNRILFNGGQWTSVPQSLTQPNWTYEKDLITGAVRPIGLGAPNTVGFNGYARGHSSERSLALIYGEAPGMIPGAVLPESYVVFADTGRLWRPAEWPDGSSMMDTNPILGFPSGAFAWAISEDGRWALVTRSVCPNTLTPPAFCPGAETDFAMYLVPLPLADPVTVGFSASYPAPFLNVKYPEGGLSTAYARWCPPSQPGYLAMTLNATANVVPLSSGVVSAVIPYGTAINIQSDAMGLVKLPFPWPTVLTGHVVHAQMALIDPSAPAGYVLTDTVRLLLP